MGLAESMLLGPTPRSCADAGALCALQVSVIDQQQEAKVSHAMRVTPGYGQVEMGPPVNLSGGDVDRTAFLQASLIRDTTFQHNQSPLGARDIFTVGCQPHCGQRGPRCKTLLSGPWEIGGVLMLYHAKPNRAWHRIVCSSFDGRVLPGALIADQSFQVVAFLS